MAEDKDCWASWLERMRTVGAAEVRRKGLDTHATWREQILENARLQEGERLLDVGCGEGLVAFGALTRRAGEVVFSDVSDDLLDFCRERASELGVLDRCAFVNASADDLAALESDSFDAVTTRAVLIYVADKERAFREFARVLRSGGRISLLEPINRFAQRADDTWLGFDLAPVTEIARKLRAIYDEIQPPDTDPMLDFDERDLIRCAEDAGFQPIQLRLEAEIRSSEPMPWDTFVGRAGNPRIPTMREAMEQALTPSERDAFTAHLRPQVEEGLGTWRMALAYLHATKP